MPFRSNHKPQRLYLTPEQVEESLISLLTDVAIFATQAFSGLRNSELCHLRVEDADFERGLIRVFHAEGGAFRVLS